MDVLPGAALPAAPIPVHAMADAANPSELLDVEMEQIAGMGHS